MDVNRTVTLTSPTSGGSAQRDDVPGLEELAVGCEASSDALLLGLCLQDQVVTSVSGMTFRPDRLICFLARYLNRLKEDDEVCAEALQRAQVFLFHRLSPLLQPTERGTFRAVALMSSGTHRDPQTHSAASRTTLPDSDAVIRVEKF